MKPQSGGGPAGDRRPESATARSLKLPASVPPQGCNHSDTTCPSWQCRTTLWALGIEPPPSRRSSAIARRIDLAWRLEPLPGRLASDRLRGRGDLAAAC